MKQVVSRYPYESQKGHCLKNESEQIQQEMVNLLQKKITVAGAKVIITFQITIVIYKY